MSLARLGLRARLAVGFVAAAVFAVALAAFLGNLGLTPRINEAARLRLDRSAKHAAELTAAVYRADAGWTPGAQRQLKHLAALDDLRLEVRLRNGRTLATGPAPRGAFAEAPVVVSGRALATVSVSAASGSLLTPDERHLHSSLDRLHLYAAAAAAFAALLVGLFLAETLTRPLRRIRGTAEALQRGDLDARVDVVAEPEMKAVGSALNRLAETLEHEEELRRASVADLAHELRTPVNGLLQRIEAAQDDLLPLPQNLAAMHDEALRLTRLLDDLARLADAEQPGLLLEMHRVDLASVAGAVADGFASRFAEAGIGLEVAAEPVAVSGDPGRLEQIVSNLLSNALRYTDEGGEVVVSVGRSGSEAYVQVRDTGIGIAPDDLRHVFTRFWRSDRSRSRATGGTGIGLAIVRELVRAHEGRIDVDSTPGHGSSFRVVLPLARHHEP